MDTHKSKISEKIQVKKKHEIKEQDKGFKHGELRQIVLSAVGVSVLLGGTFLVTPNFPIVFASILALIKEITRKDIPQAKVRRVLANLEKKEIISLEKTKSEIKVRLKGVFTPILLKYSLKPLLDFKKKNKKWNNKWFIVSFDVPEKQRNKRDYLRRFIHDIGFYQYQKSVYVFPYDCEKEIALIKKIVESGKYISYIIAEKIEHEKQAKIYFGL